MTSPYDEMADADMERGEPSAVKSMVAAMAGKPGARQKYFTLKLDALHPDEPVKTHHPNYALALEDAEQWVSNNRSARIFNMDTGKWVASVGNYSEVLWD